MSQTFAIEQLFSRFVDQDKQIHNASLLIHSEKHGMHLKLAAGSIAVHPDQPYHIASITKLFTAVLTAMLVERGLIAYEDTLAPYIDRELLHQLHVYKGVDYTPDIRIKHLLNHTSGLHCFFEDKPKHGKSIIELIFDKPDHYWTPQEMLLWSKTHLSSRFPPGQGFHYSDTGYNLLGLIIENVTRLPYHAALRQYILDPLGMDQTYFTHGGQPKSESGHPVARLYAGDIDVTDYGSLSISHAGGAIISTSEDLLTFMKALVHHRLLNAESLENMKVWARFFPGINYGFGIMSIKPVFLFMPGRYQCWGNAGSTGTFLFYHPEQDAYLIGALNQFRYNRKAFKLMFKTIDKLIARSNG